VIEHLSGGRDMFVLIDGILMATRFSVEGREVAFQRILPGQYFGHLAAVDGLPRSASVYALSDSCIARIPAAVVDALLAGSLPFVRALARDLAGMVRGLRERLFERHALTVSRRVAFELFRMACAAGVEDNAASIRASPTHAELASLVGGQREAVTREYQRLAQRGIIRRAGRTLHILDVRALADLVGEREAQVAEVQADSAPAAPPARAAMPKRLPGRGFPG
jgi:CRP-like cAMP-binding protein